MSFFGSNPFATPVGQRIEKATSEGLASEDWGLNMEICDIINETEEGPKDAVKAIKKRLIGNKNWKEVMFSLTVLETCVKNCGHRFHIPVCKQEFVKELVKIIQPNMNPPTVVQEKILSIIQSWADAFRSKPDLQGVVKVYEELKQKGIEFPATNLDELSPIVTPQRGTPEVDPAVRRQSPTRQPSQPQTQPQMQPQMQQQQMQPQMQQQQMPQMQMQPQMQPQMQGMHPQMQQQFTTPFPQQPPLNTGPIAAPMNMQTPPTAAPVGLTPEQLAKLKRDLEVVLGNVKVMSEMLTEMVPGQEESGDLQLLLDVNKTCRAMQGRVVELISSISNEEVTGELLRVNDDLNNVFVRFDRFERYRQSQANPQPQMGVTQMPQPTPAPQPNGVSSVPPPYPANSAPPPLSAAQPTLIDFGADEPPVPNAYAQPAPVTSSGDMSQQFSNLDLAGGNVSQTLNQINSTPAVPSDEFDMFAQSRQTTYTDSRKSGSTYQDILNLDQSGVTMGNLVNARANPFSAAPVAQPTQEIDPDALTEEGLPPGVDVDEMEKWLNATDLDKENDGLAAQNTNAQPDGGITSSEFDQFLETRAKAADTLPPPNHNNTSRQTKMEETDNTMFAL